MSQFYSQILYMVSRSRKFTIGLGVFLVESASMAGLSTAECSKTGRAEVESLTRNVFFTLRGERVR